MKRFRVTSVCMETFTAIVEAESDDDVRRFHDGDIAWDYPATTCDATSADWKVEEIQADDPGQARAQRVDDDGPFTARLPGTAPSSSPIPAVP